jgi:hypothetical protein
MLAGIFLHLQDYIGKDKYIAKLIILLKIIVKIDLHKILIKERHKIVNEVFC